jgi:phosphohistidine phosphatase
MHLAIIRHGVAEDGADDFSRALTARGRKRFKAVVAGLGELGQRFELVLHSPKVRALETAELLAPLAERLEVTTLLARAPSPALLDLLKADPMAVVGHEPHLSALAAWLTLGDQSLGKAFELKKGGVLHLEGTPNPGGMRLTGLLAPRFFRRRS